ncbi:GSCOCG00001942001-RA-CDS, partial [Cotesia congregata]
MVNRNQTAIVAISCDDRQKDGKWYYTDLFYNTNWIRDVLNDWNKPHENKQSVPNGITGAPTANDNATNPRGCGNCIFNFYISVGCKEKGNCPKGSRVMTNGPTASHNVRQVTNREFTDNWSHANQDPNRWSKQAITN